MAQAGVQYLQNYSNNNAPKRVKQELQMFSI